MSEETVSQDVVKEARALGWVPKEEFRGDCSKWVEAEEFVERGKVVMPLLKKNNQRLQGELNRVDGELKQTRALLRESQEAIEALKKDNEEIAKQRVKDIKKELLSKLKQAKTDGDVDAEVELTDELTEVNAALKEPPKKEEKKTEAKPEPKAVEEDPALTEWKSENPWFGRDSRRTSLAIGIAQELREQDPEGKKWVGKKFFDKVAEEMAEMLGEKEAPLSRVSSGTSSSRHTGTKKTRGYDDLPAEAKAACDKQSSKFAGKAGFKDEAAYRTYYANLYFGDEQ